MHSSPTLPLACALLLGAALPAADTADRVAAGKAVYERPGMCITCHQADGKGVPQAFPALAGSSWVTGDEATAIRIVLGGLEGEIKIGNTTFNAVMPAQGGQLTDADVADVLTYVRSAWNNKAPAVAVNAVAKLRGQQKQRGEKAWTANELQSLNKKEKEVYELEDGTVATAAGTWTALPEPLPPTTGEKPLKGLIKDNVKPEGGTGVSVFNGTFRAEKAGDLQLFVRADTQVSLWLDDQPALTVGRDPVISYADVPPRYATATVAITAGPHRLRCAYLVPPQGVHKLNITAGIPGMGRTVSLSDNRSPPVETLPPGMDIVPDKEPRIYRAVFDGTSARSIAVGYPEKVSFTYDAVNLQWRLLWRGAFISGGHHWTGRGMGFQEWPLGSNLVMLPPEPPFATLAAPDAAWPAACDMDTWPDGYRFLGYALDAKQRPAFRYRYQEATVTDTAEPAADGLSLRRRVHLEAPKDITGLLYRAIAGRTLTAVDATTFTLGGGFTVRLDLPKGVTPTVRHSGDITEVLVPVTFTAGAKGVRMADLVSDYRWEK